MKGVCFEAALDAAGGHRWPSEPVEGELDQFREPTQRRRILRSARLLGLCAELSEAKVERIRDHLGVAGLWHHCACVAYRSGRCLEDRGQAILALRQQIPPGKDLVPRLLAAGSLAGLWGPPQLWDPVHGRRISLLSRATRASRAPPAPPTNSFSHRA